MSSCGTQEEVPVPPKKLVVCPECGAKGHPLEAITLKALLRPEALARLEMESYYLCSTPLCRVVYFTAGGESLFPKSDLKVRVGRKETEDPIPICYCFGHTRRSIREEICQTGRSTVAESIASQIRAGRCGCEVNNPSGSCCLGEIHREIQRAVRDEK